ncbi:hypothetical protein UlMin_004475 [Ulmus minor]
MMVRALLVDLPSAPVWLRCIHILFRYFVFSGVEYDPRVISFRQLMEVFWSRHDSRQVFGQGTDEYRSIIFTNGTKESKLAAVSKEESKLSQKPKFELKRNPFLLQLIGNLPEEELDASSLATTLDGYNQIDAKVNDIIKKGWPMLREV